MFALGEIFIIGLLLSRLLRVGAWLTVRAADVAVPEKKKNVPEKDMVYEIGTGVPNFCPVYTISVSVSGLFGIHDLVSAVDLWFSC